MSTGATLPLGPRVSPLTPAVRLCALLAGSGGAACWVWLLHFGAPPTLVNSLLCMAPAATVLALGQTAQDDRNQYLLRLLAAATMLPMLLMMWASSQDVAVGDAALALSVFVFIVLHLVGFAACLWQLASLTTRIEAELGTRPVGAPLLAARLRCLLSHELPWTLSPGGAAHEWVLDSLLFDSEQRYHRVLLSVDDERGEVQVRERLGIDGAPPRDAEEAGMRGGLQNDLVDAARPQAQRVWQHVWQTTLIEPARLAALRLHLVGAQAQVDAHAVSVDSQGLMTLLAALATRSGYAWQPVMLRRAPLR